MSKDEPAHGGVGPWNLNPRKRAVAWRDVIGAEIVPTRFVLSGQPVLRLVSAQGQRDVEIPRSFVKDWDALLAEMRRRFGPIENKYPTKW